jgi:hypothetical protein
MSSRYRNILLTTNCEFGRRELEGERGKPLFLSLVVYEARDASILGHVTTSQKSRRCFLHEVIGVSNHIEVVIHMSGASLSLRSRLK